MVWALNCWWNIPVPPIAASAAADLSVTAAPPNWHARDEADMKALSEGEATGAGAGVALAPHATLAPKRTSSMPALAKTLSLSRLSFTKNRIG